MRKSAQTTLLILCTMFVSVLSASAQEYCKDFIVLDEGSSTVDIHTYALFQSAVCKSSAQNQAEAQNVAQNAGIDIPLDGVMFGLDFAGKSAYNEYSEWKTAMCASSYGEISNQLSTTSNHRTFSDNARDVVNHCLSNGSPYGYFEVDSSGTLFAFKYSPGGPDHLLSARVEPSAAVTCDATNPLHRPTNERQSGGYDISGKVAQFSCGWKSNKSVSVTLELANGGTRTFDLPPRERPSVVTPAPPAPAQCPAPPAVYLYQTSLTDPAHMMKSQIHFPTPADSTCTLITKAGGWSPHVVPNDPLSTECPDVSFYHGPRGSPGYGDSGPYDHDYSDNGGVCAYAYSCVHDQ